mmetsp:Transcript_21423/g.59405  ORF Transcript_21423/g.59405 Transcript_21423/m.59405 type:complete len:877 (+) Transcript_21423:224-2854(+)
MPWFWGSSNKNQDKEEDDESEYDSEEYTDEDEEEEDDESEIEDEEESIEKEDSEDESLEASSSEENEDDEHDGNANNNPKENNEQDIRKDDENGEERPAESKPKDPELGKFILAAEDSATEQTSSPETSSEETTPLNNHIVNADDQDNDTKVPAPEAMDMPSLLDKDSPAVEAPTEETPKPAAAQEETVQQTDKKSNVIESRVEEEDSDDDDGELGELVLQGAIPGEVVGNRDRAPSALTHEEDENISRDETTDSADSEDYSDDDEDDEDEGEKETSLEEKQSLLILAAQYDRVDILNTVLTDATTNATKESDADQNAAVDEKEIKSALLHGGLPPLHVAILSGSMNAINCLLRVGADPSVRPDLSQISAEQLKTVKDAKLMDGVTAWELAFGNAENTNKKPKLNLPPSKQEGIQHAFSAEALRCIGSDEVDRLEQILNSGVPAELDMGGKSLYEWSSDMKAPKCQSLLRPEQDSASASAVPDKPEASAVLDRPSSSESVSSQINRLDELESLARALSSCLDNLAEEVSVCHGLLLMGNGASALATHVRSLKGNKEGKADELSRLLEAWENSEDELAYWVREAGDEGKKIAQQMAVIPNLEESAKQRFLGEDQDEEAQHRQLIAQIAASENKIRKLRVAITDLSEENTRDLAEVERRGLSGGINLVRGLKDEIRELEFQISEAKSGEAGCRAKTSMIQAKIASEKKRSEAPPIGGESEESPLAEERMEASIPAVPTTVNASQSNDKEEEEEEEAPPLRFKRTPTRSSRKKTIEEIPETPPPSSRKKKRASPKVYRPSMSVPKKRKTAPSPRKTTNSGAAEARNKHTAKMLKEVQKENKVLTTKLTKTESDCGRLRRDVRILERENGEMKRRLGDEL